MHAILKMGDLMAMISDASEHAKATPVMLCLYVPDVDAAYQKATKAGATSIMKPADQFYGDRSGGVKDAAGNSWFLRHPHRRRHVSGIEETLGGSFQEAKQGNLEREMGGRLRLIRLNRKVG
jgi:hypothetical protein